MILSLLYLVVPPALAYVFLDRAGLFRSLLARVFTAWFVGVFAATLAVYAAAMALAPWTQGALRKAALLVLFAAAAGLLLARRPAAEALRAALGGPFRPFRPEAAGKLLFLCASGAFAFFFYRPHLAQTSAAIYRSPVYWDLKVHLPIVQNFVFGDNFPAQNESFAGAPETYHFFFDLLTAIPVSFGVDLAPAFLLVSAGALFAVLGLLAGFAEELTGQAFPGMLAALLACTSSSLRFLDFFRAHRFADLWTDAFQNRQHPYLFSFLPGNPNPFAYNGSMFNLFYFVAERQLVFASGFLLASVLLLQTRARWNLPACFAAGVGLGLFCFWHLFVTISLGAALVWLLATSGQRRQTAAILAGMAAVGIVFLLWTQSVTAHDWFRPEARPEIRFDPAFPTALRGPAFSLAGALGFWTYAWGLKLPIAAAGLVLAFRTRRPLFDALACVVIPTFLLVSTVRLFPLSVYDNHKWLRPMNLFVDLAAGFFLVAGLLRARAPLPVKVAAFAAATVALTLSGALELVPFLRSRPTVLYANYPTPLTGAVRARTAPRSVFVSLEANALHLAGRRLFVGNDADERGVRSLIASAGFDVARRQRIVAEIQGSETREDFCRLAHGNRIDWVDVAPGIRRPSGADDTAPGFDSLSPAGRRIRFLDVRRFCGAE